MKKKRKKQLLKQAKKIHKEVESILGWGQTEQKCMVAFRILPEEWEWLKENSPEIQNAIAMGNARAYAWAMEQLEKWMQDKDASPQLIKLYMAERHGITDKVPEKTDEEQAKTPVLNVILDDACRVAHKKEKKQK
jgi:hypothetical protein